jgi:ribose/xylose/arabinose/galactoside ABC-type transport system permease subunit
VPGLAPLLALFRDLPMLPVILVAIAVLSVMIDGFTSVGNMQNIMRQLSVILIAVTGETMVLLIGGIDLSIGATIGLASVCGALTMQFTGSPVLGLLACLATGAIVGTLNGLGIARAGLQPFIMTFGMMLTVRALGFLFTGGRSIGRLPQPLLEAGRLNVLGLPLVFILGLSVAIIGALVLRRTVFGQKIYLIGSNPRAAAFSGLNVEGQKFQVYLIAGILAGFAAYVFMMRLGAATPTAGDQLLLQIIGAVVLGGTALTGGEGGIVRSITGAVLVAILIKSLEIMGAQFWDQMIFIGVLTALGSALGAWLSRRRTRESNREDLKDIMEHMPIEPENAARMRD